MDPGLPAVERGRWTGPAAVLPGADPAGPAVILVAAAGSSGGPAARSDAPHDARSGDPGEHPGDPGGPGGPGDPSEAAAAWLAGLPGGHRARVLLSSRPAGLLHLAAINAGLHAVCLPVSNLRELQRIVATHTETIVTVDAHRHLVTTGKDFLAEFQDAEFTPICAPGSPPVPAVGGQIPGSADGLAAADPAAVIRAGSAPLADRIRAAQLLISNLEVPSDVRIQLQRRLLAVCDATKSAGLDTARCERRLASLLAELDRLNTLSGW